MSSRRATRTVLLVLAVVLTAGAIDGVRAWRQHRWNDLIDVGPLPPEGGDPPAQLRFAQAYAQSASGADEVALNRYRSLHGDSPLGQAARYNSANLLMRQAAVVRAGTQPANAIVLIELAKETYREVLRTDPGHWDARYNLERAQRLLPDPDDEEQEPAGPQRNAERAATTMRGYSPGMP
jgi:mxaK protein